MTIFDKRRSFYAVTATMLLDDIPGL